MQNQVASLLGLCQIAYTSEGMGVPMLATVPDAEKDPVAVPVSQATYTQISAGHKRLFEVADLSPEYEKTGELIDLDMLRTHDVDGMSAEKPGSLSVDDDYSGDEEEISHLAERIYLEPGDGVYLPAVAIWGDSAQFYICDRDLGAHPDIDALLASSPLNLVFARETETDLIASQLVYTASREVQAEYWAAFTEDAGMEGVILTLSQRQLTRMLESSGLVSWNRHAAGMDAFSLAIKLGGWILASSHQTEVHAADILVEAGDRKKERVIGTVEFRPDGFSLEETVDPVTDTSVRTIISDSVWKSGIDNQDIPYFEIVVNEMREGRESIQFRFQRSLAEKALPLGIWQLFRLVQNAAEAKLVAPLSQLWPSGDA